MSVRKAKIGEAIYDVISVDEYNSNREFYRTSPVAVKGGDGYLYPLRTNSNDMRPGFFDEGPMQFFNPPRGQECPIYSDRNIIDFSKASCIKDIIEAQDRLADAEREILTTVDNLFIPPKNDDDTPEMSLLKEAITEKKIDIDKYEGRFGVAA